jgi:deoxyribose-phosphate aldolase
MVPWYLASEAFISTVKDDAILSSLSEKELDQLVSKALAQALSDPGADSQPAASTVRLGASDVARLIDHTLLIAEATESAIQQLCREAKHYRFASVCVNPTWAPLARGLLVDSPVKVATVVGFPLGATLPEVKAFEAERAIQAGAHEIDMVINIGRLKSGHHQTVFHDVTSVVAVARRSGALVKAIIETALLTEEEKVAACVLAQAGGVDFVKTSTGMSSGGATVADVALIRRVVGPTMGIKASGGVRSLQLLQDLVAAGATRIGARYSLKLMDEVAALAANGHSSPSVTNSGAKTRESY